MKQENYSNVEDLFSKLRGNGSEIPLSKFVELNLSILNELKKIHIPLNEQAKRISEKINKKVSPASLSVAMSRLNCREEKNSNIVIMEKKEVNRFVSKSAILTLGSQVEKEKIIKNGIFEGYKDKVIDWRGLHPNENISNWIMEYKEKLIAINHTGWRWVQIAEAINNHLSLNKKISVNTLTSIISISNKKNKQKIK